MESNNVLDGDMTEGICTLKSGSNKLFYAFKGKDKSLRVGDQGTNYE